MMGLAEETTINRLRELYPCKLGTTLIRLRSRDKKPLDSGWNTLASENFTNGIDPGPILEGIAAHLDAGGNVGWAIPPGVLVLDADNAKSAAWLTLAVEDAPLQRTAKGCHVVVKAPPGLNLSQRACVEICEGVEVDLRTSGAGQIACEPSIHPTGFEYTWERTLPLELENLPELPAGIVEKLKLPRDDGPKPITEATWKHGTQHTRLVSMAGRLRTAGLSVEEIEAALEVANRNRCEVPGTVENVAQIARSAGKWDQGADPGGDEAPRDPARRFPVVRFGDITPQLDQSGLIRGVVSRESMTVVYGQSNSSKTFLAIDMALSVASGRTWMSHRVEQGLVVYIAAEGGSSIQNRISAYRTAYLQHVAPVHFVAITAAVNFLETEDVGLVIDQIREIEQESGQPCALVIGDTLSRSMPGGNENGPEDMTALIGGSDRLRQEIRCAMLWVHHSGKDEARGARGHSSLRAATDTEIEVVGGADKMFQARATKQRDREVGAPWFYRLDVVELGEDDEGEPVTSCVIRADTAGDRQDIRRSKPSPSGEMVLEALESLSDQMTLLPQSLREDPKAMTVGHQVGLPATVVRDEAMRVQLQLSNVKPQSAGQAFKRGIQDLQTKNVIQVRDGWLWFIASLGGNGNDATDATDATNVSDW